MPTHPVSFSNTTTSNQELILGVLGGMGPQATADFLAKLVALTPVSTEQDHLHVLIDSNPKVPDRNQAIANTGTSPAPALATMAFNLQQAGAGFLVMACNTAHAFEAAIRQAVSIPFVSMIEETCAACVREYPTAKRIGLLAAPGCVNAGLYQAALARHGLQALLLGEEDQQRFNALLYRIKTHDISVATRAEMKALGDKLIASGADILVAACTEVPLVLAAADLTRPLIDATSNLASRCVRYARRLEPIPLYS